MIDRGRRVIHLWVWTFAVWILLTWTPFTALQEGFGAALALVIALAVAPLGPVAPPWRLLTPRRLPAVGWLVVVGLARIVAANLKLARRIWAPSRPLASGMVVVPTAMRTPGELTAVALISSLIVDNQIVDLDVARRRLQYHAVAVPAGDAQARRAAINGPVERLVEPLVR
jgi:multicomponent Na+:H+ antiporter subunit E